MCVFLDMYVSTVAAARSGRAGGISSHTSSLCMHPCQTSAGAAASQAGTWEAGQGFLWLWPYLTHGKLYSVKYWAVTSSWPPQRPWWHYLDCSRELQLSYMCHQGRERGGQSSCRKAAVSVGTGWKNWNGIWKKLGGLVITWSWKEQNYLFCPGLIQKWKKTLGLYLKLLEFHTFIQLWLLQSRHSISNILLKYYKFSF